MRECGLPSLLYEEYGSMETRRQEAEEVLDGVMLGDGGLVARGGSAYFDAALSCRDGRIPVSGLLEYLQHLKDECFDVLSVEAREGHPVIRERVRTSGIHVGETYECASLATKTSAVLALYHHRWYNGGRYKEVPVDLVLTPISLAHWFMGDGTSCRAQHYPTVYCEFSTQGFRICGIEVLEDQLRQSGITHIGRKLRYGPAVRGSGVKITILQDSLDDFMDLVDPYVIEPYRYKVKYRRAVG